MAAVDHITHSTAALALDFASLPISALSDMLDACDSAFAALLGIMNLPRTSHEACGLIEDWVEEFAARKQALIAEMEGRRPADWSERRVRAQALTRYAADHCKNELDVIAYLSRLHSGSH